MATFKITDPTKNRLLSTSETMARAYLKYGKVGAQTLDDFRQTFMSWAARSPRMNHTTFKDHYRVFETKIGETLELWHTNQYGEQKRHLLTVQKDPDLE